MASGWIKIHKQMLDWEWISCPETLSLWIHLLMEANYEDKNWKGIVIPRGSLVTTLPQLSRLTGLTIKQVRTNLSRLISTGEVADKATNKYRVITICKYDTYQVMDDDEGQAEGQSKGRQRADKGQTNGEKKESNKESKEYTRNKEIKKEQLSKDNYSKETGETILDEILEESTAVICGRTEVDISYVEPKLRDKFREFLAMRRKIGKPLKTATGVKARYDRLIKLSGGDIGLAKRIADQTIEHEWQDFFELHETKNSNQSYTNDKYW